MHKIEGNGFTFYTTPQMFDSAINCCNKYDGCSNYIKDNSVRFKIIDSKSESIPSCFATNTIHWLFLLSGSLIVENKKGGEFILNQGEMIILPSDCIISRNQTEFYLIYFTSDRPTEYCVRTIEKASQYNGNHQNCATLEIKPVLYKYLDMLQLYLKSNIDCSTFFHQKQEELFMLIDVCYKTEELLPFLFILTLRKTTDLNHLIVENCLKARSVEELATLCGYSSNGFRRVFKDIFDQPIYNWMQQQKAEALKFRLIEKDTNLKMLIADFGFSSPAHLTKFCKQWLGMSPTQYIRNNRSELFSNN